MNTEQHIRMDAERDADPRIDLAVERTMLALERTQLAWVRTIIGLIAAGIAIDRGFEALHAARLVTGNAWAKNGHLAGLVMAVSGTLLILISSVYYIRRMNELGRMLGRQRKLLDPGMILSLFITGVGFLVIYFMVLA
jgi:putative membrane protein